MYLNHIKGILDFIVSLLAIVILLPLLVGIAVLVWMKLGRPVIFSQIRPGKDGRLFKMYKFRSMTDRRNKSGDLLPDKQRMTTFGRKLRETSLDELPGLINVLKGEMSLVGPRPQLVRDMVFFTQKEMERQSVYPGLTGLAQISGRNNILWKEKFSYDLQYIRNVSFIEDIRILYRTVFKVAAQEDIATKGMETAEDYGDWLLRQKIITEVEYNMKQAEAIRLLEKFKNERE